VLGEGGDALSPPFFEFFAYVRTRVRTLRGLLAFHVQCPLWVNFNGFQRYLRRPVFSQWRQKEPTSTSQLIRQSEGQSIVALPRQSDIDLFGYCDSIIHLDA
jgi:hypothetical protein